MYVVTRSILHDTLMSPGNLSQLTMDYCYHFYALITGFDIICQTLCVFVCVCVRAVKRAFFCGEAII